VANFISALTSFTEW